MADAKAPEAPPPEQEAGAQPGALVDPFRAYNFKLLIDGVSEGHFTQCTGLQVKVSALHFREGGAGPVVRRLPGPVSYGDVTLRYGLTSSPELWAWFLASVNGVPQRKNVSVLMLDIDGVTERLRWNLNEAWPTEWKAHPLDALGQQIAIDSLTLVFESISRG
ncbi:phage tail protein [Myxococcus sp. RHSTA-1-4]|uniref:phage tail protein n=1 Tax=Myxococcus sp. RHSTA-1-4 TaxID=2874601 RepID=UPI001CBC7EEA|nr:phage tail protein [Myxococcus sp. RHSTA-1-4]MBZ4419325.1 phage tail protein [Myxococcus sp. RHSTA-1-4]